MKIRERPWLYVGLGILLVMAAESSAAENPRSIVGEQTLTRIRDEVSGSICFEHIRYLSTLHRIWGSRDFHKAAQYTADKSQEYGLAEVKIEQFPGRTGRENYWMHSPGGNVPWDLKSAEFRLVEPFPRLLTHYENAPSTVAPMSRAADVEAELINVGRGDRAESYAGKDLKGKIVLAEGGRHENVHEAAVHGYGALGTVHFNEAQGQYWESEGIYWGGIRPWSRDGKKASTFGLNISSSTGRFLKNLLSREKRVVVSVHIEAGLVENGVFELATAVIPGTSKREEEFIFYSHLDHPKPGAHDNASGNAVMLEIARTLSSLIRRGILPPPQRSIRFLWIPHMFGLNLYFVHHPEKIGKVKGGCNIDCVGADPAKFPTQFYVALPPHSLPSYLTDITGCLVEDVNRMIVGEEDLLFSPEGSRNLFSAILRPYQGASDEYTANTRSLNMPSIYFYNDPLPPRHNQINFLEYLDRTNLGRISYLGAAISYVFASCGRETALTLLPVVSSRGSARMHLEMSKARRSIAASTAADVQENFSRAQNILHWGIRREQGMIASLEDVLSGEEKDLLISERRGLEEMETSFRLQVQNEYERKRRILGRQPDRTPREKEGPKEMKAISILNSDLKGSIGYFSHYLEDKLGPDFLVQYQGLRPSIKYGNVGYYETLNFIDGRNTIRDIFDAVRGELWSGDYHDSHYLSLEETLSFFRLLEAAGVITFQKQ